MPLGKDVVLEKNAGVVLGGSGVNRRIIGASFGVKNLPPAVLVDQAKCVRGRSSVSDGKGAPNAESPLSLDGQPLAANLEMWAATLPSPGPFIWMPAIRQVRFEQPPGVQKWTLSLLPDSAPDGKKLHFKLEGSLTGADGEGWSDQRFVSPSGRVVVESSDWHVAWPLSYRKKSLPEGFQVRWSTYQTATPLYHTMPLDAQTVLLQGCANAQHLLRIEGDPGKLGIDSFIVHTPAGR